MKDEETGFVEVVVYRSLWSRITGREKRPRKRVPRTGESRSAEPSGLGDRTRGSGSYKGRRETEETESRRRVRVEES